MSALHDIAPLAAAVGWHHDGGWWSPFALLWIAALTGLIWFVVRAARTPEQSAMDILAERYARGEISSEDYRERLDELRRHQ